MIFKIYALKEDLFCKPDTNKDYTWLHMVLHRIIHVEVLFFLWETLFNGKSLETSHFWTVVVIMFSQNLLKNYLNKISPKMVLSLSSTRTCTHPLNEVTKSSLHLVRSNIAFRRWFP